MNEVVENFKKYGAPISDCMDIETIADIWSGVDGDISGQNANISQSIQAASSTYNLSKQLFKAYSSIKKAKDNMSKVIEAASAAQQGMIQFPLISAQEESQKKGVENSSKSVENMKSQIFS